MSDALKPQLHGRDHRPGGRDPIPNLDSSIDSAFANCSTGGTSTATVSNNTLTDIRMDQISIASGSQAFAINTAVTSEKPLKCILNGWYFFHLNFEWSGLPYTDVRTYSLYVTNLADNVGDVNIVKSESSPNINAAFNGTFGPLYIRGADLSGSWFKVRVHHQSGALENVTGVLLTAIYLGSDLDPSRMPPF